ncbi:MAG TPA: LamG-like jellyroll fold domain-containing protein [Candidatus Paceibacterota bacterium]|nr:LamG-like jellyroll fold domain-containing protein [Candidatus Paceibacterota bacterium]
MNRVGGYSGRLAFTLVELLIVIAIIAIVAVVLTLVLNPAELLRQSRDANRLSDMSSIQKALALSSVATTTLGNSSTTYLSVPDPAATTTAGSDCSALGLTAPYGWAYHCPASSTYKNINGTGWLPINFQNLQSPPAFSVLPIDPVNTSSSGLFYTYTPARNGAGTLSVVLESAKYEKQYAVNGGGMDPSRYSVGDSQLVQQGEGLEAWWKFDDGSGPYANDSTADNDQGRFWGSGIHWSTPRLGTYSGIFNGIDDRVCVDNCTNGRTIQWQSAWSLTGWVKTTSTVGALISTNSVPAWSDYYNGSVLLGISGGKLYVLQTECSPSQISGQKIINDGNWHYFAFVRQPGSGQIFVDGSLDVSLAQSSCAPQSTQGMEMGYDPSVGWYLGSLDDVRIYTRPLLAGEILRLYSAFSL